MITILVVDDHPVFLEGVAASLSRVSDFTVVGVVTTGEEAVSMGEALRPDIVLMDLNLPGISGVEATRRLTAVGQDPGSSPSPWSMTTRRSRCAPRGCCRLHPQGLER